MGAGDEQARILARGFRLELSSRLENGATVSDWLGTARTAAVVAVACLDRVRDGRGGLEEFTSAELGLKQALEELDEVRSFLLYGPASRRAPADGDYLNA